MSFQTIVKSLPFVKRLIQSIDNQNERDAFVKKQLSLISPNSIILDAGCGSQRYRAYCKHLEYRSQDFGKYAADSKTTLASPSANHLPYGYGELNYVGDIWNIDEEDGAFDAILCTEVLEHVPFPNETIKEFSRLLRKNGVLILTAPGNCLRHMDPYFFYSGFSDRWYQKLLTIHGLRIEKIEAVGDYYSWLSVEMARTGWTHSIFAAILVAPAFLYFRAKRKTPASIDTLCMGYHVVARKS